MRAITIEEAGIVFHTDMAKPVPRKGEALVRIQAAALNRRDHWITLGQYPKIRIGSVLGSDGCGIVEQGDALLGAEVILCPSLHWGPSEQYPGPAYTILGMPKDGCFADLISIPQSCVYTKPAHLTAHQAAALPLAGLTAWRALFSRGGLQKGERVLITGIGGGVSLIAMQLALAAGAEVYVTSSSAQKIEAAVSLGAQDGFLYTEDQWHRAVPTSFQLIFDSAGGAGFGKLVRMLAMGGRLVFIGGTQGRWPPLLPQHLFFKQASILGSTMGSPREFQALLRFVEAHHIIPHIDTVYPIEKGQEAFARLIHTERMGKVILSLQ